MIYRTPARRWALVARAVVNFAYIALVLVPAAIWLDLSETVKRRRKA